jgi:hypothetical protein
MAAIVFLHSLIRRIVLFASVVKFFLRTGDINPTPYLESEDFGGETGVPETGQISFPVGGAIDQQKSKLYAGRIHLVENEH